MKTIQCASQRVASLCSLLAVMGHFALAVKAGDIVLSDKDNGTTVSAVAGQSIEVQLHGNPTTGYAWTLVMTNNETVLPSGASNYIADPNGGVGAGGTYSFPFQAATPGMTTLTFSYARSWDPGNPAQTFIVTIDVSAGMVMPRLTMVLKNGQALISWPMAGNQGFYLEGKQEVSAVWAAMNVLAVPDGLNYTVTLPTSGEKLFFRLRQ